MCVCVCVSARGCRGKHSWLFRVFGSFFFFGPPILCPISLEVPDSVLGCADFVPGCARVCLGVLE